MRACDRFLPQHWIGCSADRNNSVLGELVCKFVKVNLLVQFYFKYCYSCVASLVSKLIERQFLYKRIDTNERHIITFKAQGRKLYGNHVNLHPSALNATKLGQIAFS